MLWARRLEIKGGGKPFGQWKSPGFGCSDDVKGVQWNIHVDRNSGEIRLGVNLEGSAKGGGNWLITDFILSELARPTIESIRAKVDAGRIQLTLACDAWQGARVMTSWSPSNADSSEGLSRPEPAVPRPGDAALGFIGCHSFHPVRALNPPYSYA
jgi:hypothetical protein